MPPPPAFRRTSRRRSEHASVMVEFVGALPLLALGLLVCAQGLLAASAAVLLQVSAEQAARGSSAEEAAEVLPEGWREGLEVERSGTSVRVTLPLPMLLPGPAPELHAEVEQA